MKEFIKSFWDKFREIFGLKRNDKYVRNYLNEANMRSGVFMAAIIFALEMWLLVRQTNKYILPSLSGVNDFPGFFELVFKNTSNFWIMLSFGAAMMIYCAQYLGNKSSKGKMITTIVFASLSLAFVAMLPFEFIFKSIAFGKSTRGDIAGAFKLTFYIAVFLFAVAVIFASIYHYKGGRAASLSSVIVISLFSLVCLMFGVMVSYSDFTSTAKFADGLTLQHKQIICFLTMVIYVGCLLIWNPIISIGLLGSVFLAFYIVLNHAVDYGSRQLPEGDAVNYVTFMVSLVAIAVSIYNQRVSEATKDKELVKLATKDELTDLYAFEYFLTLAEKERYSHPNTEWIFVFANVRGFKVYNDQKGFEQGNKFLKDIGQMIEKAFNGAMVSRPSDDHFVVFTKNENIREQVAAANAAIQAYDEEVKPTIACGGYVLENGVDMHAAVDKARYVASLITKGSRLEDYLLYTEELHDEYIMAQYIVRHVDEAIEKDYLQPYFQPVVWSDSRCLCGVEALARWNDPQFGFLSPGKFVPVLEAAHLIHKLDTAMLRSVCKMLRHCIDNKLPVLPTSINFSRADFGHIDVVKAIDDIVNEYKLPHDLIHVEITESALTDDEGVLHDAIDRLHKLGYALWLDDFGSGYSSFNVLKDYDFDVLKLDMKFLSGFDSNQKSRTLISSVIKVANELNMMTLSEGVETQEEAEFLESVSCGRLQGYLYGKPLSFDELMNRIKAGDYKLAEETFTTEKVTDGEK